MIGRKRTRQASKMASAGGLPAALLLQREVDHHDRVLLDDADQHDQADEAVQIQVDAEDQQGQQRADAGRRQAGQDGQRMNEALVENAKHEIDHEDRTARAACPCLRSTTGTLARCPGTMPVIVSGILSFVIAPSMRCTAWPRLTPGARLNDTVTAGTWPRWLIVAAPTIRRNSPRRTAAPACRCRRDM